VIPSLLPPPPRYYRGTHGVIVVYDVTNGDTFKSIKRWLQEIDHNCENVGRILVGNKIDDPEKKVVPKDEAQHFADQIGIQLYETSAKDNINIEEVFHAITRLVLQQRKQSAPQDTSHGEKVVVGGGRTQKKKGCC
jgi:Ras-related protein Rab-35